MKVPFVDLPAQHRPIQDELNAAVQGVIEKGDFALGQDVFRFEEEFSDFCGTRQAVGVNSGLSALELGLRAFDIGPGDEVIVPAHTFIATAAAVTFSGARLVLVDIDPATYNMDTDQVAAAVTCRTRAIIPVHLYGLPAEMDTILAVAEEYDLVVIEDACQAHGAQYKGRPAGSLGHAAAFSFYPTKNLGGCGEAGMLTTDDSPVADRVRAMRNCGQKQKHMHEFPPFNRRLDTIQAAVLRVKLRYLDGWIDARRRKAALYSNLLTRSSVVPPIDLPELEHVYHLYVGRSRQRDRLISHLHEREIGAGIHYPTPIHLQPFYAECGFRRGQFPVTERICTEILSLPIYPEMSEEQVRYVAEQVIQFDQSSDLAREHSPHKLLVS